MKILKILLLTIWSLFFIEYFFRIFHPIPLLPRYIAATDYGIRGNKPNSEYKHKTPDYKVHFKVNSKGVRADYEIPYEKADGVKRIVLLGDSFGMGYGVNLDQTFSYQLKDILDSIGYNVEIVILAVSGHGNAEELLALRAEGFKYEPDIVLLQFHRSDFDDNVRSNLFTLNEDTTLVQKNDTYLPAVKVREKLFSYGIYRWLAGNCHTYSWLREFAGRRAKSLLALRNLKKNENEETEALPEPEPDPSVMEYDDLLTIELLKQIKVETNEAGAELVLFEVPIKVTRTTFRRILRPEFLAEIPDFAHAQPVDAFIEKGNGQKLYWERSHGHFTPLGCRLVAEVIAEKIIEEELLED